MSKNSKSNGEKKMKTKKYLKLLRKLQGELCHLQEWVKHKGLRVIIVFEGRDAAGKGGTIKAITERVSPRVFRLVALPAPSDREKTQMYIQRYMQHFPAAGEVVIFDRSWYNRAGVERVMGFCTEEQTRRFLEDCGQLEKYFIEGGLRLIKFFFNVSREEQERRFKKRFEDPRRQWKLSPMDLESWARWWEYTEAYTDMFNWTDTAWAPWYVVEADDKRRARLNCIAQLLDLVPYKKVPFKAPEMPKFHKRKKGVPDTAPFKTIVPNRY
jgi:polyphosphate kinase 2